MFKTHAADDRARAILVTTLYTQPSSLAIGALCGILTSATAAIESGNRSITLAAWVMSAIALMRVASATILPRWMAHKARALEIIYELGAFSYSIMAGMIAALTFFHPVPGPVRTLMVGNAIAYSVGIAARNAGRPAIAIGQLALALLPVIVAAGMQTDLASQLLAFTLFLVLPAMMSITLNVFRTLRDSIASAETSQRLAEKMQHLARTDIVTGLLNRAGLNHHLVERLVAIPEGNKLAILWLDLDRFKEINDTLGHQVGDRCLVEVAARLRRSAPVGAGIGRFGGDEFIIAFEAASDAVIKGVADTILNDILRPLRIDDDRLEIGCSIGIAILPEHGTDLEAVLQGADLALNHAKLNGRKQIVSFNPAMTRDLIRRKEIEAELRLALQRDELSVHFQPLVDLETGRIRAFEALVRWFHPEKGELRPDEFIPVAEESGAIITLGNWITAKAARVAAEWPDDVTLAVNLSPLQIRAPGAALGILNALREAKLPPSRLELEITETTLLDHSPNTSAFINELAGAGVRFALDDFGTGYSSLGYLDRYPFKKIKIDRSFISGLSAGTTSHAIICAVAAMGKTLGMEIVAEGLETLEQVQAVRDTGCTLGQGWYFSRAVPDYLAAMLLAQERRRIGADAAPATPHQDSAPARKHA
ncbi:MULTISPECIES: putative bifunctional diguanylate cyclase/phosphodiesterase [unclassified Novosphingobium]|uniref:putative bifunctional diguanylate cyclase/phosphodiesterase n=1 Tax=unclassified Novosphingobium TaxID=2644732 RepID=UPI00144760BF|nr:MULTISPECIES: EAL domain-containing protein [unclassified Novosphingobium]MDR6708560.1 diguanylate cyclase (GGDEF)-like protein [Novosphingobium sp. 1748]NKJ01370.1 diguanylate cyclase (GGDEF)-like protein [Novosphingobium sp. SG707]